MTTMNHRQQVLLLLAFTILAAILPTTLGFLAPSTSTSRSSQVLLLSAKNNKNSNVENKADFEYQELKIVLQAMKKQDVVSARLKDYKQTELEGYVRKIVNRRPSSIPLCEMGQHLPGTEWRLAFTTQALTNESLPKDALIKMTFHDASHVDYGLEFSKTFGLKRLAAKSSYTVDSSPVNPGLVTITYESITTDVFGLKNLGFGMFGMLQGRATYIPTAYFDGTLWIEQGTDQTTGIEYCSVYTLEEEDY